GSVATAGDSASSESSCASRARASQRADDGDSGPLALPDLALQREGALGARLEARPARAPHARPRLPAARLVGAGARNAARSLARRQGDRRLDAHHPGARTALARPPALPARRDSPPPRPRARGFLRRGARPPAA